MGRRNLSHFLSGYLEGCRQSDYPKLNHSLGNLLDLCLEHLYPAPPSWTSHIDH